MGGQSVFGPRGTLLLRIFVGAGWVFVGVASIFGPHPAYPADDQRSGPFFWPELGLAGSILGAVIVAYAIRDFRRRRRDEKTASTPSDPGDIPAH